MQDAMYKGDFFRSLLGYMEEAKVLPKRRADSLYGQPESVLERSLSTRELMALAIRWGITTSAAQFWQQHKTKDALIRRLRLCKAELEYEPPEHEEGPMEVALEHGG